MGLPLYDASCRTSQVTSGQVLCALLPAVGAAGSAVGVRTLRVRQIMICNTTATGFGVGVGLATAAGATPAGGVGSPPGQRRGGSTDAPSSAQNLFTTYATQPTAPAVYPFRLWVPGSSMVILPFAVGDELVVAPAATPLPFCIWNTGTGQIADVSITWEE